LSRSGVLSRQRPVRPTIGGASLSRSIAPRIVPADQRLAPFAPALSTNGTTISAGKVIDSTLTFDLNYRLNFGENTTFTFGVNNIADEDPSFARLDLNYDPFTGDAVGRTFRAGIRQRF